MQLLVTQLANNVKMDVSINILWVLFPKPNITLALTVVEDHYLQLFVQHATLVTLEILVQEIAIRDILTTKTYMS